MNVCDLHTHSVFSDGTYTPGELLSAAEDIGLSALALCDHNTVAGLPDFLAAAQGSAVEAVPGAEFSTDLDGTELHLLGLFIPTEYFAQVSDLMAEVNRRKEESNLALVDSLARAGYPLDYAAIRATSPGGTVNRAHIAAALTAAGFAPSIKAAFASLLAPECGHYREPKRLTVWAALDFVRSIGAVPVLAHPFLSLNAEADLLTFLPRAKKAGLVGMECRYSTYSPAETRRALELAEAFGLRPSGGSDFHGGNKPDIHLGSGKGDLAVPLAWLDGLRP